MRQIAFFRLFLVASLAATLCFTGCKKKKEQESTGSGAAPAAPSGSAATGSGSAQVGSASADVGSAGSGSSMAAGSAAAGGAGCSATAYKSAAGAFCIDAPKDYKITESKESDGVTVVFEDKTTMHSFHVRVDDDEDNRKFGYSVADFDARAKDPENKMLENAEFGGGIGRIQVYTLKQSSADFVQVWAIVKGKKHRYSCGGENLDLKKDVPLYPDACKSLRPLD